MFPEIRLSESIFIPTYYLVISLTTCLCLFWIYRRSITKKFPINTTLDLSLIIMVAGFLGGRLFHIFYEAPDHYLKHPLEIGNIGDGGFIFFGGFFTALASSLFYLKKKKLPITKYLDLFAPVLALGYGLGRSACLMAGCCYGKTCDLPWALNHRHPTQLYAVIIEIFIVGILLILEKSSSKKIKSGDVFYSWIAMHGLGRLFMEYFRDDYRGPEAGLTISSWLSLALIVVGIFLLSKPARRR